MIHPVALLPANEERLSIVSRRKLFERNIFILFRVIKKKARYHNELQRVHRLPAERENAVQVKTRKVLEKREKKKASYLCATKANYFMEKHLNSETDVCRNSVTGEETDSVFPSLIGAPCQWRKSRAALLCGWTAPCTELAI